MIFVFVVLETPHGSYFTQGCNDCVCFAGQSVCTKRQCAADGNQLEYTGKSVIQHSFCCFFARLQNCKVTVVFMFIDVRQSAVCVLDIAISQKPEGEGYTALSDPHIYDHMILPIMSHLFCSLSHRFENG